MIEHFFQCPYCWEKISMFLERTIELQTYVEDCEICCNPIQITASFESELMIGFDAISIEQ